MRAREIIEGEAIVLAVDKITDAQIDALEADLKSLDAGEHDETEHWHFDDRFHLLIAAASGNVVLPRLVEELRVNARLFRLHSPLHRQRENHDEHGEIIHALRARDPVMARNAMCAHLRSLQEDVKRAIVG
ncbi:FCD domain protein [compost metagenome]